jgi:RNA ligase (TIGR02306 family)
MRKLAKVVVIDAIHPIEGADAIEVAIVGGWKVVAQKGLYTAGDKAVYFEIDSWMPSTLAPFLSKGKEPKVFNGISGERLRTVRLRGQISQGLLMPIGEVVAKTGVAFDLTEDLDLTESLGIQKWERAVDERTFSGSLSGMPKGNFPSFIPKTDQERVQNIKRELREAIESGETFEVTEKLEGSSMTVFKRDGEFGVCSRNLELKRDENNAFWKLAIRLDLENKLADLDNIALQGEMIGPGIQGNIYNLTKSEFMLFNIFDIKEGKYLLPAEHWAIGDSLDLYSAPILKFNSSLKSLGIVDMETAIAYADGNSDIVETPVKREGVVFKSNTRDFSFKVISNAYLIAEKG